MQNEEQSLVLRDNAKYQLQQIKDVETGIEYLNKVKALEVWVKAEKKDAELQNMVAEQKLRTQRILGQLIKKGQEDKEIATQSQPLKINIPEGYIKPKTLSSIGITLKESSIYKTIASIPDEIFEQAIIDKKDAVDRAVGELTTAGMLKMAKINERECKIEIQKEEIRKGIRPPNGLYDIISIDPPWPYGREYDPQNSRVANPYPEMSIDEIKAINLPLKESSIVFFWTTHKFLPDAFDILNTWGFEYKATLVWNKENMGMGSWFRMQCEFCLFAIKGDVFWNNTYYRDIINETRREHSRKPDAFFNMVDNLCIGNKLEYFSREKRNGWDNYGDENDVF